VIRRKLNDAFRNSSGSSIVTAECGDRDQGSVTPSLRDNRLRLLSRIRATLNRVADFSQIEG
jgi:hypothetical protein